MSDVITRKLADLKPDAKNANKGTRRGRESITHSLSTFGAGRSILIDGDWNIIAGNKTHEAAAALGIEDVIIVQTTGKQLVAVQRTDLDLERDPAAQALAIADNFTAFVGLAWDEDRLREFASAGVKLTQFWTENELAALIGKPATQPDPDAALDKAEQLQAKWQVQRGDVWQIGDHRLLCGDCTQSDEVARLMGGATAAMLWTDPPYGVSYVGKTADGLTLENDGAADLPALLKAAFANADRVLTDGAPIYIAHPAGPLSLIFGQAVIKVGWRFHETLVWVKNAMVLGHADYHYQHEPILYGWKGANRRWFGGRNQVSVFTIDKPQRSELHPTMKPTALIVACLQNSSAAGDVIYEPFAGSGGTLVACAQTGRRCFAMELAPKYCAVILERLASAGSAPEKVAA